jgi:hypothetical protein
MDPSETSYIHLTGSYQRPKPRMVERSAKANMQFNGAGYMVATFNSIADRNQVTGKAVAITWLEEEK